MNVTISIKCEEKIQIKKSGNKALSQGLPTLFCIFFILLGNLLDSF
jgi:hypothetical protein